MLSRKQWKLKCFHRYWFQKNVSVNKFIYNSQLLGEILRQFENAGVKCCVTVPQLFPVIEAICPKLKGYKGTVIVGGETEPEKRLFGFKDIVVSAKPNAILPEVDPNEVKMMLNYHNQNISVL